LLSAIVSVSNERAISDLSASCHDLIFWQILISANYQPLHQPAFGLVSFGNVGDSVFSAIHQQSISSSQFAVSNGSAPPSCLSANVPAQYQLGISKKFKFPGHAISAISLLSVSYQPLISIKNTPSAYHQLCISVAMSSVSA
jgi:hypothetical protein